MTNMGEAVDEALDALEKKITQYKKDGATFKAPFLLLLTDGEPSDDITSAASRCASLINKRRLVFMGAGVGDNVNISELKRFNPNGKVVISPKHSDLKELMKWVSYQLSGAVSGVDPSQQGGGYELDPKFKLY